MEGGCWEMEVHAERRRAAWWHIAHRCCGTGDMMNARRQRPIVNVLPFLVRSSRSDSSSRCSFVALPACCQHCLACDIDDMSTISMMHPFPQQPPPSPYTHDIHSSIDHTCPFSCLILSPFFSSASPTPWVVLHFPICLMKLFACIIKSFWYFTFWFDNN